MNKAFNIQHKLTVKTTNILSTLIAILLITITFQVQAYDDDAVLPVKRALPKYPAYAINNGIEGTVLLNFSIEKDGNLSDIEVVASDMDGLFDASAILGLQKWLYQKPSQKLRNNYVAIEFALTKQPKTSQFSNVEKIQIMGK